LLATKYRTKKAFLDGFTSLHIFVVSLRCEHSCSVSCARSRRASATIPIGWRNISVSST
jgi:hypothetical protein